MECSEYVVGMAPCHHPCTDESEFLEESTESQNFTPIDATSGRKPP